MEFILWNKTNSINVQKALADIADIKLTHDKAGRDNPQPEVCIDIVKKKRFELSDYIDIEMERKQLAQLSTELMKLYAKNVLQRLDSKYGFFINS